MLTICYTGAEQDPRWPSGDHHARPPSGQSPFPGQPPVNMQFAMYVLQIYLYIQLNTHKQFVQHFQVCSSDLPAPSVSGNGTCIQKKYFLGSKLLKIFGFGLRPSAFYLLNGTTEVGTSDSSSDILMARQYRTKKKISDYRTNINIVI